MKLHLSKKWLNELTGLTLLSNHLEIRKFEKENYTLMHDLDRVTFVMIL